jgi:hypothetical protein
VSDRITHQAISFVRPPALLLLLTFLRRLSF